MEVWGCGTVWSCVLPDIGHTGNRNAFFCVIQAVVESLNICLVGHAQKNLHFDTAIPFAANDCCVQNFRLTKESYDEKLIEQTEWVRLKKGWFMFL